MILYYISLVYLFNFNLISYLFMDYNYKELNNIECICFFLFLSIFFSYVECS